MTTVPETFRRMPRWWHDQPGHQWLDQLPNLVTQQCRRWNLRIDGDPSHGSNALVVPVRQGHRGAVLRLSPPVDDVAAEAAALRWWAGRGTVRLYDVDVDSRAMLLERLSRSRSLQSEPLAAAVPAIAALVREMAVSARPDTTSTAAIAADHVASAKEQWSNLSGPSSRAQLNTTIRRADELAHTHPADTAVNGDLHCQQVLAADRAPWSTRSSFAVILSTTSPGSCGHGSTN